MGSGGMDRKTLLCGGTLSHSARSLYCIQNACVKCWDEWHALRNQPLVAHSLVLATVQIAFGKKLNQMAKTIRDWKWGVASGGVRSLPEDPKSIKESKSSVKSMVFYKRPIIESIIEF